MHQLQLKHTYPNILAFYKQQNIQLVPEEVTAIHVDKKQVVSSNNQYEFDALILATGSKPVRLNVLIYARNTAYFYSIQDLQKLEILCETTKKAVVIGAGLIGIELVEMLLYKNIKTTFISKDKRLFQSLLTESQSKYIHALLQQKGVEVVLNCTSFSFSGGPNERLTSVHTPSGFIEADLFCFSVGVEPNLNVEILSTNNELQINKGVVVNEFLQTNFKSVYAAGDCAELATVNTNRKSIEATWYVAAQMGEVAGLNAALGPTKTYEQNNWFNSAKFLGAVYQVYGFVPTFEALHHTLIEFELKNKWLVIAFEKSTKHVVGFQSFNLALRQVECEKIINQRVQFTELQNLPTDYILEPELNSSFSSAFKLCLKKYV